MKLMKFGLLVLICFVTAACASKQGQAPATEQASTEWRIKSLEESFLNFREMQRQQADKTRESNEDMDKRLTAIELELAALKASAMTDASDTPDDMTPADPAMGDDLKPEPGDAGWVDGPKGAGDSMAQSTEEKPWDKVPGEKPTPAPKMAEKVKTVSSKPMKKVVSGQAMYDVALAKYNLEKYDESRAAFDAFMGKYPKSDLVPNALYWKGETYYSQKDFAQAILSFKDVTSRYPKHSKAAAALLKIGMSYERVGDKDNAIFYLRALVEDFPKSSPATMARKELKRLGS